MALDCEVIKSNFKKSLLRAVEEGLLALGETPREVIYFYLKTNFQLKREDIPKEIEKFDQALNGIFGPGAEIIEKFIIKGLYRRLNMNFKENEGFEFVDYVKQAELSLSRGEESGLAKDRKARAGRRRRN